MQEDVSLLLEDGYYTVVAQVLDDDEVLLGVAQQAQYAGVGSAAGEHLLVVAVVNFAGHAAFDLQFLFKEVVVGGFHLHRVVVAERGIF